MYALTLRSLLIYDMQKTAYSVFLVAALCGCLLYDTAQLFRITLLCAAIHEAAHIFVYVILTKHLPKLIFRPSAIELKRTCVLSKRQDIAVTIAGPLANFAFALLVYAKLSQSASYTLYFMCTISICVGAYNLLPVSVLDGARLVKLFLPSDRLYIFYKTETAAVYLLCAGISLTAVFIPMQPFPRAAMLISCVYILCTRH